MKGCWGAAHLLINGGVISAGFDAASVLAGLGQYGVNMVVTLELTVQFLSVAKVSISPAFHAEVVRSAKNFCFAKGTLFDWSEANLPHFAVATGKFATAK